MGVKKFNDGMVFRSNVIHKIATTTTPSQIAKAFWLIVIY